jgi:hypothetical protein
MALSIVPQARPYPRYGSPSLLARLTSTPTLELRAYEKGVKTFGVDADAMGELLRAKRPRDTDLPSRREFTLAKIIDVQGLVPSVPWPAISADCMLTAGQCQPLA